MFCRTFLDACRVRNFLGDSFRHFASASSGPNDAIIDMLKQNMNEEEQSPTRNGYKVRAFSNAIKVINLVPHAITSAEEASKLRGVGVGITKRIAAFLSGQEYREAPLLARPPKLEVEAKQRRKAMEELMLVPGIGSRRAEVLVEAGCTCISELHDPKYLSKLTPAQKIGLKFFRHLQEPVQREESELVAQFITDHISSKFQVHLAGSYRRGTSTSSDIDILIFHPTHVHIPPLTLPGPLTLGAIRYGRQPHAFRTAYSTVEERFHSTLLNDVVRPLEERGLLAETLSSGARKWHGIVRLPERDEQGRWLERGLRLVAIKKNEGVYRRLDLNLVPMKSKGAALLALTGDVEFNRDIRTRAAKLGMHLNEFGLWKWQDSFGSAPDSADNNDARAEEKQKGFWRLIKAETEEQILQELGMDYVDPEKRNFSFVIGKASKASKPNEGRLNKKAS